ncbi:MAG: succinate dehydrogenase, hydrophobic membrane anchor protein [Gammaproteobacteria bacterium]|nr:succinate dehydrogenase, hydrophobic membrane anchor protein [Gammaproteobacteria bacterium]MCI0590020.1 succinate dehydrogenase, hydrophobic membrane anchor protein [Gammaproteobacteria bacterium]
MLRPPIARVRGLGSAKDGVRQWWAQRVTAVALVPLTLWFIASVLSMVGADYAGVVAWIQSPSVTVLFILFFLALFYHAQLGMQVIIEDYIHTEWLKFTSLIVLSFTTIFLGIVCTFAVLKVSLGS